MIVGDSKTNTAKYYLLHHLFADFDVIIAPFDRNAIVRILEKVNRMSISVPQGIASIF